MTATTPRFLSRVPALAATALLATTLAAQTSSGLTVINAVPGPEISLDVNGMFRMFNVPPPGAEYREIKPFGLGFAAPFTVDFLPFVPFGPLTGPLPPPFATGTLDLPLAGDQGVVLLHPDGAGVPVVSSFIDDTNRVPVGGPATVTVRNVADAASLTVVLIGAGGVFQSSPMLNGTEQLTTLPGGDYTVDVFGPPPSNTLLFTETITVAANTLDNIHVIGNAASGFELLRTQRDRGIAIPLRLTEIGADCAGATANASLDNRVDGSFLEFAVTNLPPSTQPGSPPFAVAPTILLVGLAPLGVSLDSFGAPGCSFGLDPLVTIPVNPEIGFGSIIFPISPTASAILPPTYWQFLFFGAPNASGLGFTRTFELTQL